MTDEDMSVTRVGCLAAESLFRKPLFHYFPDSEVEKDKLGCAHAATVTTGGFHSQTFACHCTKWSIDLTWKIVIFQFPLDAHNRSLNGIARGYILLQSTFETFSLQSWDFQKIAEWTKWIFRQTLVHTIQSFVHRSQIGHGSKLLIPKLHTWKATGGHVWLTPVVPSLSLPNLQISWH